MKKLHWEFVGIMFLEYLQMGEENEKGRFSPRYIDDDFEFFGRKFSSKIKPSHGVPFVQYDHYPKPF